MNRLTIPLRRLAACLIVVALVGACDKDEADNKAKQAAEKESAETSASASSAPVAEDMKSPADFEQIDDQAQRSRAIFGEIGKVLLDPRCVNCHPSGDRPMQGEDSLPHQPLVVRGAGGMGEAGMRCTTCHGNQNFRNVPGTPGWRLAPKEMAWQGKSLAAICEQLKDSERNGGRSLGELADHMANNHFVAYGWNPPSQLEPLPGSQARFAKLTQAWVDTGAECPKPDSP